MRHCQNKKILDRPRGSRRALLRSLAINLILTDKIKTTRAKAKALKPFIEKLVSFSRVNNLVNHRKILSYLNNQAATKKLLEVLGPKYQSRPGGYTRIIKLKQRQGDAAQLAIIEFI